MSDNEEIIAIHRYLSGEMEPDERKAFDERLKGDAPLSALTEEMRLIWNASLTYTPPPFEKASAYARLRQHIRVSRRRRRIRIFLTASAAILLLAIGVWSVLCMAITGPFRDVYASETLTTTLDDGTELAMREGAHIRIPETFSGPRREVEIVRGDVYFEVAPDVKRPFIITHEWAEIEVVGTKFDVSVDSAAGHYVLRVTEGHVRFTPSLSRQKYDVYKGMRLTFNGYSRELSIIPDPNPNVASWNAGELKFVDRPLSRVIEDLEAHYHVDIELKDPAVGKCLFTASVPFRDVPVTDILDALTTTFGMELETGRDGTQYLLKGGKCQ